MYRFSLFAHRHPSLTWLLLPLALAALPQGAGAQRATIAEEARTLETYPFSEPNPVPILTRDRRLYPYHSFEGYTATSEPREWKVVRLENEHIQVFVLPEVGGKVWGALVKETGHEFIYRNEVMKFRNIALRGPWTSGGIEMNFGVIGHTPSTATPVDYLTRENPDGSVSCIVGSMDLPSRTHWRVEVHLPPDKAYFETRVLWYNPTPLEQPYYNWMTAAAFAREDLEMTMPGDRYLRHSGEARAWPEDDQGRYLPLYRNNTFEGHKSYHVVGETHDFFGGYYLQDDYGFGHWSRYEEMPGQKLWLWALSREGGVWEDLLTDTDGQYVEFQAGRLFVQYSPGAHLNPITEARFEPVSASSWSERWFPLEGIGGLTEASGEGALHVDRQGARLSLGVNAFSDVTDTLKVWSGEELVLTEPVSLRTLEPFRRDVTVEEGAPYRVRLSGLGLDHDSDPSARRLSRPFETDPDAWASLPPADRAAFQARERMKGRRYGEAESLFQEALRAEPWHREALLGLSELGYRRGDYEGGLGLVNRVLQLDAYDGRGNFLAGIHYAALGQEVDARDAFGWAARTVAFRAAANVQMAKLLVRGEKWAEATHHARRALDFDGQSVPAWHLLAILGRIGEDGALAQEAREELLTMDPLHHFSLAEAFLETPSQANRAKLRGALGGEFPGQTLLELVLGYVELGLTGDALNLLQTYGVWESPLPPVHRAWMAWLSEDPALLEDPGDPAFAFPYRPETLPVLQWAVRENDHWVWRYLLGLNLWALHRDREGAEVMKSLGNGLPFGPGLAARGLLAEEALGESPLQDLRQAVSRRPEERILHVVLIQHLLKTGDWQGALDATREAEVRFPGDFNLALLKARALIQVNRPLEAAALLARVRVLPSENARDSHRLWEEAHLLASLDALEAGDLEEAEAHALAAMEWPESLGQGRPYQPEERLARFILGWAQELMGDKLAAGQSFQAVVEGASPEGRPVNPLDLLIPAALRALGRQDEARDAAAFLGPEGGGLPDQLPITVQGRMILRALSLEEGR